MGPLRPLFSVVIYRVAALLMGGAFGVMSIVLAVVVD
jgi:hypothetical protein